MKTNKELIESLEKHFAKEKGRIIFYNPKTGKLEVDKSQLRKDDNRNFVALTKKILNGTYLLKKAEDISGIGYEVYIKGGPNIKQSDIDYAQIRLRGKASITSNLSDHNRDRTEITIRFNKNRKGDIK